MTTQALTIPALLTLALGGASLLTTPALNADECAGGVCNEVMCAEIDCNAGSIGTVCWVMCDNWVEGACGTDPECAPHQTAFICWVEPE